MLTISDVRKKVEDAKNDKAKAEGGLDRIKKELKEKFGCKCMSDAKKLLKSKDYEWRKKKVGIRKQRLHY